MAEFKGPKQVQKLVRNGFARQRNFRQSRLMFIRNFIGPYYDRPKGEIGTEPLNLIFNAIRILVPNIVMNFPKFNVSTDFAEASFYAELQGLALDQNSRRLNIRDTYRRLIVDALFLMGILKTGLSDSNQLISFDDELVDPGEVYTDIVDFDNFVVDPGATDIRKSTFYGDKMRVPRQSLLDAPAEAGWNKDLIQALPSVNRMIDVHGDETVAQLSQEEIHLGRQDSLQDEVELVELWIPEAQSLVVIPAPEGPAFDEYIRVTDYYGPDEGPYTFLSFTPPVPDNPFPVSLVGMWNDLHVMGNRTVKKILDQADRQKDLLLYKRSAADDALEVTEARDGDSIATDDPDAINQISLGGQNPLNPAHIDQIMNWFNMMAANPQGVGGLTLQAASATEAGILQSNASIGLEDMKDLLYQAAAEEGKKRAWYMHYDPLIELPVPYRQRVPAQFEQGPLGPVMMSAAREEIIQVVITPEIRRGDWLHFRFEIEPESMGRIDSETRLRRTMEFMTQIVPAVVSAAQIAQQMGVAFSLPKALMGPAKEMGITWLDDVFTDPEFQMQRLLQMMPQSQQATAQPATMQKQILQNSQPASVRAKFPSVEKTSKQNQQQGANEGQGKLAIRPLG